MKIVKCVFMEVRTTMKRTLSVILVFLLSMCSVFNNAYYVHADDTQKETDYKIIPDEIIVVVEPKSSVSLQLNELSSSLDSKQSVEYLQCGINESKCLLSLAAKEKASAIEFHSIKTNSAEEAAKLIEDFNKQKGVTAFYDRYFEMGYTYDPEGFYQWNLRSVKAGEAWDMGFIGSSDIKVAVIDSGVSSDLEFVRNVRYSEGWNFFDNTSDVTDNLGHGTSVCGIIGAATNNSGFSGVCQNVSIIPLKVSNDSNGYFNGSAILSAIGYCIQNDIDVINYSGALFYDADNSIGNLLAHYSGIFVTCAGNKSIDIATDNEEGGKINNLTNMIVVGSSTGSDLIAEHSNYSDTYVDIMAPGESVYVLSHTGFTVYKNGTSFAAPHVAAAAALIWSNATHYSNEDVVDLLLDNTRNVDSLTQKCVTGGVLDIPNAVTALYEEARPLYSKGDLNGDGYVNASDKTICRNIISGTTPTAQQLAAGDIDEDGSITSSDYMRMSCYVSKTSYFAP